MSTHQNRPPHTDLQGRGHPLDFDHYREHAHRERTRAINHAISLIWCRISGRRATSRKDAAFWVA